MAYRYAYPDAEQRWHKLARDLRAIETSFCDQSFCDHASAVALATPRSEKNIELRVRNVNTNIIAEVDCVRRGGQLRYRVVARRSRDNAQITARLYEERDAAVDFALALVAADDCWWKDSAGVQKWNAETKKWDCEPVAHGA